MKKYIIIMIASLMATAVQAQNISRQEERQFYQKALDVMQDYAQSAAVSDDTEEFNFRRLFINNDIMIANDLMSLSHEPSLSIDDYISTLKGAKNQKVEVRNIRKDGRIEDGGDVWTLPIAFEKGISYSKSGTLFNSHDYFGEYYRLKAILSFDKSTQECFISALELDAKFKALDFPEKFTVLERTNIDENKRNYKRDSKLTINGRDVSWNRFGQVILHPGDKIEYNKRPVDEVVVTEGSSGGRKIHADYKDKSFRVRANLGYSLSGFNKLSSPSKDLKEDKNQEMSFGLDFGYVFPSTSKFNVGVFAGIGISSNTFTVGMSPTDNNLMDVKNCTGDEDGESYTRQYRFVNEGGKITQTLKASDIAVPIYLDMEYQFTPSISAYADLGVRLQTSSGTWSAEIDKYETKGVYKGYGSDLTIDGSVNLNGFGVHEAKSLDVDEEGLTKSMSVNLLAGLGLRFNISASFAIDAGIQYMGSGTSWKMDKMKDKSLFSYTLPDGYTDLTPEQKAKGDKVNLLRQSEGISHGAMRLLVGLIYKF